MHGNLLGMLGVSNVGGGRFVVDPSQGSTQLGDDGSVMMISGIPSNIADRVGSAVSPNVPTSNGGSDLVTQLQVPITLFNITLPLWAWLLIAAALGGTVSWAALTKKG